MLARRAAFSRWLPAAALAVCALLALPADTHAGAGGHVCMEKQKYNVTKRVKYRAPLAVRTYEWCLAVPPRCSRWTTELRDLTRLETEERTAEIAVCCPGFIMRSATCHPKCPSGRTGHSCTEQCAKNLWGPSCSKACAECPPHSFCSPSTGNCVCDDERKGERCEQVISDAVVTSTSATTASTSTVSTNTVFPVNQEYSTSILNTENTTRVPTTSLSQTTTVTTTKDQQKQQFPTGIQTTDYFTEKSIDNLSNASRSNDDEVKTTDVAMTRWNATKSPYPTTTNHTTDSVKLSTVTAILTSKDIVKVKSPFDVSTTTTTITPWKKSETTSKSIKKLTTQPNNKSKEIWIKPTQKGELTFIEPKRISASTTVLPEENIAQTSPIPNITTPRTIIVNIIPTSVAHTIAFKKITFAASGIKSGMQKVKIYKKNQTHSSSLWKIVTVANKFYTSTIPAINKKIHTELPGNVPKKISNSTINALRFPNVTEMTSNIYLHKQQAQLGSNYPKQHNSSTKVTTTTLELAPTTLKSWFDTIPNNRTTLSNEQSLLTRISSKSNNSLNPFKTILLPTFSTIRPPLTSTTFMTENNNISTTEPTVTTSFVTIQGNHSTVSKFMIMDDIVTSEPIQSLQLMGTNASKSDYYDTKFKNKSKEGELTTLTTTNKHDSATYNKETTNKVTPTEKLLDEDEVFDILTEPEHITAVVGDTGSERNTDNLLTVISIAGAVMFAVITVSIVIVMIERCRRSKYEDLMKLNHIRMKAMEGEEDPPPYVRSIFHAPLPDLPTTEKSHYQPISTLDRNLKQFMRPVAVHSISPIMLENFREILECHYDHLPPRRSHVSFKSDTISGQCSCSTAPSSECRSELCPQHFPLSEKTLPVTELSVETLKQECCVEVIDPTTAEPLYAEIPCWRPASQHAIEVVNLNGEAVTEL